MKGVYVLVIEVYHDIHLTIKALGNFLFKKGIWLYVGSAMGNGSTSLENRICRHFRREKTIYWHIDAFLLDSTNLKEAIWAESVLSMECKVAESIEKTEECTPGPKGFGASDCKSSCTSHLFHTHNRERVQDIINMIFMKLGLEPRVTLDGLVSKEHSSSKN